MVKSKLAGIFPALLSEIKEDKAVRLYGFFLAFTHVITWHYWFPSKNSLLMVMSDPLPICWSFLQNCQAFHQLTLGFWEIAGHVYLLLGIITSLSFFSRRLIPFAYSMFALLTAIKLAIFVSDYRFMGNYHYMPFFLSLVYIFFPKRKSVILYLIVTFYVSAGLLKLDTEWLQGAALLRPSIVQGEALEWLLSYVILFEVIGAFALLAGKIWLFTVFFVQYLFFHIYSWHIVGYFYPMVMFCVLAAFPLFRLRASGWRISLNAIPSLSMASKVFLSLFLAMNLLPRLLFPDLAITGKGRLLALNMLDARVICQHVSYIHKENETIEVSSDRDDLGVRIQCDPQVFFEEARTYCKQLSADESLTTILWARKSTSNQWREVFHYKNFCQDQPVMSWWGGF